jgi:hypothetical protein
MEMCAATGDQHRICTQPAASEKPVGAAAFEARPAMDANS